MVFSINIQRIANILQSFRFTFCFPTSKTNLSPGRWPGIIEIIQQLKKQKQRGKKRGGNVKMEWSFRGNRRQDGDMN